MLFGPRTCVIKPSGGSPFPTGWCLHFIVVTSTVVLVSALCYTLSDRLSTLRDWCVYCNLHMLCTVMVLNLCSHSSSLPFSLPLPGGVDIFPTLPACIISSTHLALTYSFTFVACFDFSLYIPKMHLTCEGHSKIVTFFTPWPRN